MASAYGWTLRRYHHVSGDVQDHLVPEGDLREHDGPGCWCDPVLDPGDDNPHLWAHNSIDRREVYEVNPRMRS